MTAATRARRDVFASPRWQRDDLDRPAPWLIQGGAILPAVALAIHGAAWEALPILTAWLAFIAWHLRDIYHAQALAVRGCYHPSHAHIETRACGCNTRRLRQAAHTAQLTGRAQAALARWELAHADLTRPLNHIPTPRKDGAA